MNEELTAEEITMMFNACMDSVDVVLNGKAEDKDRNVEHLKIVLARNVFDADRTATLQTVVDDYEAGKIQ